MKTATKVLICPAWAVCAALLASCGSSSNNSTSATLRLINATHHGNLNVVLNGTNSLSAVPASSTTGYVSVTSGSYSVTVTDSGATLASATQSLSFSSGNNYSVLASDRDGAINLAVILENQPAPPSGYGTLSVSNLSLDSGPLDIYIVAPSTTSLAGLAPTFQFVGYSPTPSGTTLIASSYEIVATAAGNVADVRFTLPSVTVGNLQIQTLIFTSTPGGALVDGVQMTQGGKVEFAPTANARVRVVSGLPATPALPVVGTVGAIPLSVVYAPNPGTYTLVAGGASTYSVGVNGTPVATLPAQTFTTGGDFTILVYELAGSPVVAVFPDNNQAPVGGDVNLRLVNAAVTDTGGLTMYDNGVQVASSVAIGKASPYFGATLSANTILELVKPGASLNDPVSLTVPQSVYTVFVFDSTLTSLPGVALVRDR
jgi:hypothetical protein